MKTVNIPADYFFKMAVKDYYDWQSALIREFIQNSVDAGAKQIEFKYDGEWLEMSDDGYGMSLNTIKTALLTLGGSGKSAASVGGLGKAKEILYFAWPKWEIKSKGNLISGSGPQYEIKKVSKQKGTTSRILVAEKLYNIETLIRGYFGLCNLQGVDIIYNNHSFETGGITYGKKIFTIEGLGDLYRVENRYDNGRVVVQAHGLYMFSCHSVLDRCYVFNITQPSYECLTSNRDSFVGKWQDKFNQMVGKVAIDSESTNLKKETIIQVSALKSASNIEENIKEKVGKEGYNKLADLAKANDKDIESLGYTGIADLLNGDYLSTESILDKATQMRIRTVLKTSNKINRTKLFDDCLAWYKKVFTEGFIIVADKDISTSVVSFLYGVDVLKMTWLWKLVVDEVAALAGIEKNYGYGLLVSEDESRLAECRDEFILYNPNAFYEFDWHDCIVEFLLSAAEELTHYIGYRFHNESFKCRFTKILNHAVAERLYTDDLYHKSKKVTRKHGIKK